MPNASLTIDGTEVVSKADGVVTLKNVTFPAFVPEIIAALRFDGSDGSTISLQTNNLTASRNGTGDYTLTFGSARSSIDYLVFHSGVDLNNNYLLFRYII